MKAFIVIFVHAISSAGKEIREKVYGAVEAFSHRNRVSSSPHHGDRAKHRTYEDVTMHKDLVILFFQQ